MSQSHARVGVRRTEAGLSLVEVVVMLAIMTVGVFGLMATILAVQVNSASVREQDIATRAARGKMDEIIATPFLSIPAKFMPPLSFPVSGLTKADVLPLPQLDTMFVQVSPRVSTPTGSPTVLYDATVTVRWKGVRKIDEVLSLSLAVADRTQ